MQPSPMLQGFNAAQVKPPTLPNLIHVIWLGSPLREKHSERLIKWRTQNPEHQVNLWIDKSLLTSNQHAQIADFVSLHGLNLCDVSKLYTKEMAHFFEFLKDYYDIPKYMVKNYSVPSDIYRFLILYFYGGWYFDTDIECINPLKVDMEIPYGFKFYFEYEGDKILSCAPSILAAAPKNIFVAKAIQVLTAMVSAKSFAIYMKHATQCNQALTRLLSSVFSVGFAITAACSRIEFDDTPCIELKENFHAKNFNKAILQVIGIKPVDYGFVNWGECSYVRDEDLKIMPGIFGHEAFNIYAKQHKIICDISMVQELLAQKLEIMTHIDAAPWVPYPIEITKNTLIRYVNIDLLLSSNVNQPDQKRDCILQ